MWYICTSSPVPSFILELSSKSKSPDPVILLPLVSKLPPSCGDVSLTRSVLMFPTVVLSAAISTPSTVPVTVMFPVTSIPESKS